MSDNEEAIVTCETTKGSFTMKLIRNWSPNGYDRAVELFQRHFYDGAHFFRVVPNFLTQFGISYSDDATLQSFARKPIQDDPKKITSFEPGFVSYAGSGPNSRTSQLFISYGSAKSLGTQPWETPIGKVIEGMESTVTKFHSYGDIPPFGKGPDQQKIHGHPEYIEKEFPLTDKFIGCHVQRIEGGDVGGKMELDPEEAERERNLRKSHNDQKAKQRHRDLRNPDMFKAQKNLLKQQQMEEPAFSVPTAAVVSILLIVGMIYALLKSRRKVDSKTN
ncbi:cyclophilin type peptidyl-prolyl cis-trans isomerase [Nitzschia inconspicua]|uniref:Cyclophilin type peptidyl-prolyl cis-trans isomerase n=1 Tax=Nitzschia inconspicua TaxID=303405 RepID=A0A9K3LG39_9STRA|nr:cyclophilin type peptidyl-prolyl cis-trans isomerase [Nitzschia inconspicua]